MFARFGYLLRFRSLSLKSLVGAPWASPRRHLWATLHLVPPLWALETPLVFSWPPNRFATMVLGPYISSLGPALAHFGPSWLGPLLAPLGSAWSMSQVILGLLGVVILNHLVLSWARHGLAWTSSGLIFYLLRLSWLVLGHFGLRTREV